MNDTDNNKTILHVDTNPREINEVMIRIQMN